MQAYDYKMNGMTPTGRSRRYTYYTTVRKVEGKKRFNVPTHVVEEQIPGVLQGLYVHPQVLPGIRELYQKQVATIDGPSIDERLAELQGRLDRLHNEEAALVRLYTQGKVSDRNYDALYKEWQGKVADIEQEISRLTNGTQEIVEDLDRALALLACAPRLFERLDTRHQWRLLQILLRHIIIDTQGKIVELELNPPFVYLTSLNQAALSHIPQNSETQVAETHGSRQLIPPSSSLIPLEPSTLGVEQLLVVLSSPQHKRLQGLLTNESVADIMSG